MRVYISGPMRGINNDNEAAFREAAHKLRARGHDPINPALNPTGLTLSEYMRIDLTFIEACDAILLLPGWQFSMGAKVELAYATYIGKHVFLSIETAAVEEPHNLLVANI